MSLFTSSSIAIIGIAVWITAVTIARATGIHAAWIAAVWPLRVFAMRPLKASALVGWRIAALVWRFRMIDNRRIQGWTTRIGNMISTWTRTVHRDIGSHGSLIGVLGNRLRVQRVVRHSRLMKLA